MGAPVAPVRKVGFALLVMLAIGLGWAVYQWRMPEPTATALTPVANKVQQALALGKPTVVEFGSVSCVGCREMKPVLAELARTHGERLVVADIDVLKETHYIKQYQIKLMPTQVFYNAQGQETGRHLGNISAADMAARLGLVP